MISVAAFVIVYLSSSRHEVSEAIETAESANSAICCYVLAKLSINPWILSNPKFYIAIFRSSVLQFWIIKHKGIWLLLSGFSSLSLAPYWSQIASTNSSLGSTIDTGRVQFGASLSGISPCILLLFTISCHNKRHESILEKASTKCTAASVKKRRSKLRHFDRVESIPALKHQAYRSFWTELIIEGWAA